MTSFIRKNAITIVGVILGLAGGYLYWYYIGCASGTCAIQSDPWKMTPYGALMGGLLGNILQDALRKRKA